MSQDRNCVKYNKLTIVQKRSLSHNAEATLPMPQSQALSPASFAGWLDDTNDITRAFLAAGQIPGLINIAGGLPDPQVYPVDRLSEIAAQSIAEFPNETLGYGTIEGLPDLRAAVAQRYSTETLHLTPENVLITTSGMQALDLIGKVLLNEGDTMAGQFPTYLGALDAWRPRRPQFRNMNLQTNDVDLIGAMTGAKFAYIVPNFSNPTGRLVPEQTRRDLIDAARQTGAWLVEDDPYGGLSYDGPIPPSALELSAEQESSAPGPYQGPVIYLGTLSKMVAPGLRVGWVIAVPEMIAALVTAKQGSDLCTSGLTQRMTCKIFDAGLIEAMNPVMLRLYGEPRNALLAAMDRHLTDFFDWQFPEGGMFVWAAAKDERLNTDELFKIGLEELVCVTPSSVFDSQEEFRRGIRLNFTINDADRLEEAVVRLARATERLLARIG